MALVNFWATGAQSIAYPLRNYIKCSSNFPPEKDQGPDLIDYWSRIGNGNFLVLLGCACTWLSNLLPLIWKPEVLCGSRSQQATVLHHSAETRQAKGIQFQISIPVLSMSLCLWPGGKNRSRVRYKRQRQRQRQTNCWWYSILVPGIPLVTEHS